MDFFDLEKIKGFLLSPVEAFNETKEDTIGDSLKYFLPLLVIYAVLSGVASYFTLSAASSMMGSSMPFGMPGGGSAVGAIVSAMVGGILGVFVGGIILHIFVFIVGGRNGAQQTIKAVIYGYTPNLLIGWIPVVGAIGMLWSLVLEIVGIREYHEISTVKAILAVILPVIILAIIAVVLLGAFLLSMGGLGGTSTPYMMP